MSMEEENSRDEVKEGRVVCGVKGGSRGMVPQVRGYYHWELCRDGLNSAVNLFRHSNFFIL